MSDRRRLNQLESDDISTMNGPATGRSLIDKFLLGIIDAHRNSLIKNELSKLRDREKRLSAARRALFAERTGYKRAKSDDQRVLLMMARAYVQDRQVRAGNSGRRSVRSLAKMASTAFGATTPSEVDRLRKKFEEIKSTLIHLANDHDYVDETIELQQLQEVQTLLRACGIAMDLSEAGGTSFVRPELKAAEPRSLWLDTITTAKAENDATGLIELLRSACPNAAECEALADFLRKLPLHPKVMESDIELASAAEEFQELYPPKRITHLAKKAGLERRAYWGALTDRFARSRGVAPDGLRLFLKRQGRAWKRWSEALNAKTRN